MAYLILNRGLLLAQFIHFTPYVAVVDETLAPLI